MFPPQLGAPQAYGLAKVMVDGFHRRCRRPRREPARAQRGFETADVRGQQRAHPERMSFTPGTSERADPALH